MSDLNPVKGTRDFFPEQMRLRNWLFGIWKSLAEASGFEEYDTCVLEHEELYIRKAGDEITQQLYSFEDKGGRRLSLRPEMTPSLARMILQNQQAMSFPVKWFSIPQCFRYERMTKGRKREHFQWNVDIIGQTDGIAEAEILQLLLSTYEKMGLSTKEIRVFFNDRRILNSILTHLKVSEESHDEILILMDDRDKLSEAAFAKILKDAQMTDSQIAEMQHILSLNSMEEFKSVLGDEHEGLQHLEYVMKLLKQAGYADYLQFDCTIVRGLSYYTGMVFEVNSPKKDYRAICGGGRYDSLLSAYGGKTIPAVGFGFGDVVILDLLKELNKLPDSKAYLDCMIIPFSAEEFGAALNIAGKLRQQGKNVRCQFNGKKMKKQLQHAAQLGCVQAVLIFPDELKAGNVVLRDMQTRQQSPVSIDVLCAS